MSGIVEEFVPHPKMILVMQTVLCIPPACLFVTWEDKKDP